MAEFSIGAAIATAGIGLVSGYVGSVLNQDRTRRLDRDTFGRALLAEMSVLDAKVHHILDQFRDMRDDGYRDDDELELDLSERDLAIFTSNTAKIGLFDPATAEAITALYSRLRSIVIDLSRFAEWHEAKSSNASRNVIPILDKLVDAMVRLNRVYEYVSGETLKPLDRLSIWKTDQIETVKSWLGRDKANRPKTPEEAGDF